eukprot:m.77202 g.77202  ORF g.77202 m.77202 type:complete len:397 (-) comp14684_c0_seq1:164-1354(-)
MSSSALEVPPPAVDESDDMQLLHAMQKEREELVNEIEELQRTINEIKSKLNDLDEFESDDEDEKDHDQKTLLLRGINIFNKQSAKKGINFLIEHKFLEETPTSIAAFLFNTEGLNKSKIGEFIGENEPLNLATMREFSLLHDFTGQHFDKALRDYLWSFRLPGEAQKIDRLMEQFAVRFCICNPNTFTTQDTCYVLAFSTIMLNTSLHNPSVKLKPTLESFISMNRGIDNGKDLPNDLLTGLYDSIKSTPFKIPDGDGTTSAFVNPERNGWLVKEGGARKTWRRRWFTLCNNCIYYFENNNDDKPKGTIPLENLQVRPIESKRPHVFEIYQEDQDDVVKAAKVKDGKLVQGKHSSYKIQAETAEEMEEWIKSIRAAMTKDPLFELFKQRRKNATNE